jgi:Putative metallopeptidase
MVVTNIKCVQRTIVAVWIGLTVGVAAAPQARSQTVSGTIADRESIFIDPQTFSIVPGRARPDGGGAISNLGGRDLGGGAIIYRSGDRLYILGAPLTLDRGRPGGLVVDADQEALGRIRIQYEPPKNPEHLTLYMRLMENKVLETIQQMLSPLRLPKAGLLIKTMGCDGLINAWYSREGKGDTGPTVHMCYEMLQNIIKITTNDMVRPNVTRHDAIVGQFLFWTLHETGHAVFDAFQVPLFGREEDAADQFAAFLMLAIGRDQSRHWIEGAAYTSDEFMADVPWGKNYASTHGLPQQRFYNLLCLAYGADPKTFADVTENMATMMEQKGVMPKAQQGVLPKQRAENCAYEFESFRHAWEVHIRPHVDFAVRAKVMDMAWFPEPMENRVRPSPTMPTASASPSPTPSATPSAGASPSPGASPRPGPGK